MFKIISSSVNTHVKETGGHVDPSIHAWMKLPVLHMHDKAEDKYIFLW
jgi:hypothetical protein